MGPSAALISLDRPDQGVPVRDVDRRVGYCGTLDLLTP